jgi:hypothetical protein
LGVEVIQTAAIPLLHAELTNYATYVADFHHRTSQTTDPKHSQKKLQHRTQYACGRMAVHQTPRIASSVPIVTKMSSGLNAEKMSPRQQLNVSQPTMDPSLEINMDVHVIQNAAILELSAKTIYVSYHARQVELLSSQVHLPASKFRVHLPPLYQLQTALVRSRRICSLVVK